MLIIRLGGMRNVVEVANRVLEREDLPLRFRSAEPEKDAEVNDRVNVRVVDSREQPGFPAFETTLHYRELGTNMSRSQKLESGAFVYCPRITPSWADHFRQHGIMYLDERGNCFIEKGQLFVDVRGRTRSAGSSRQAANPAVRTQSSAAQNLFAPRRAQVSGLLLSRPELLGAPTREIAQESDTSVGTTVQTLGLLLEAGYLFKADGGFRFEPDKLGPLIDAWADAYPAALGKRLELFRGHAEVESFEGLSPLGSVSGERAVPELVRGGDSVDIYLGHESDLTEVVRHARIRRDPLGNVIVRRAFWRSVAGVEEDAVRTGGEAFSGWSYALSMLVYSDLRATRDSRLLEVAEHVKKRILGGIRER